MTRGVDFSRPGITHIRTIDISKCMDIYAHDIKWNLLNPALWCVTFLHGSGSTRSHLCRGGAVLGQGVLLPRERSLGMGDRGLGMLLALEEGALGRDLGQKLCIGSIQAVELVLPCFLLPGEHPPVSSGWVGWDVAQVMVLMARIPHFPLHSPQTSGEIHLQPFLSLCLLESAARGMWGSSAITGHHTRPGSFVFLG